MTEINVEENQRMKEIGNRLSALRIQKGLSRQRLAEMMGISLPSLAKYASGGQAMKTAVLVRLALYLGVSLDWLLLGNGGMSLRETEARARQLEPLLDRLLEDGDILALLESLLSDSALRYEVLNFFFKAKKGS